LKEKLARHGARACGLKGDSNLTPMFTASAARERELAFLLSPRFARMLEQRGLRLGRLGGGAV
jgi:hypothetical protein